MHRQVRFMARSAASYAEGVLHKNSRKRFYILTKVFCGKMDIYGENNEHYMSV